MAEINQVDGENRGDVMLYAISTCVWCKKTKRLLKKLGVAYKYIDVDKLSSEERDKVEEEVKKWNPRGSFPTLVFNQKSCVVGYKEYEIKMELKK
jgi:glutaredoxin